MATSPQLDLRWQGFQLSKRGNAPAECEDAFGADPVAGRFAVADGASESGYARLWARFLAECYLRRSASWSKRIADARVDWLRAVGTEPRSWHAETKFEEGAFAAFLGLHVGGRPSADSLRWTACAVGDCCLFQVRDDALVESFPIKRSSDFDNRPRLLGSRPEPSPPKKTTRTGQCRAGDSFYLTTDALACWFLQGVEEERCPWAVLSGINSTERFSDRIDHLRSMADLRNDDVAFVRVEIAPG